MFLFIFPAFIYLLGYLKDPDNFEIRFPAYSVPAILLPLFLIVRAYWVYQKAIKGKVEQVTGIPELKRYRANLLGRKYYEFLIGNNKFRSPIGSDFIFEEGGIYTFYYSPYYDGPFSVEPQ